MKILMRLNTIAFLVATACGIVPLCGQQRQLKIKVGEARKGADPVPQPGELHRIDSQGDVVFEFRNSSGAIQSRRVVRRNKVVAEIAGEAGFITANLVRYTYTITNGQAAKQPIQHFAITTGRPDLITNASAPGQWRWGPSPVNNHPRFNWHSLDRSTDVPAGAGAGPFRFDAPMLPGLMQAYVLGYVPDEERIVGFDSVPMSPWLVNQIGDSLMYHNEAAKAMAVGPKFPIAETRTATQLSEAIGNEMLAAAGMPEFHDQRLFLENTGTYVKTSGRTAAPLKGTFRNMGSSAFQKSFFRAMALNLEYLEKLQ